MDNIPEREQPEQERVIKLGEEFTLLDPKYTKTNRWNFKRDEFSSTIKLKTENNIEIPLNIYAVDAIDMYGSGSEISIGRVIAPFDPEEGYPIDSEDFNKESRLKKIERLKKELQNPVDSSKAPLCLFMCVDDDLLTINKVLTTTKEADIELPEEILNLLNKLRILLFFPKGSYEGRLQPKKLLGRTDEVEFADFYPIDSGPFAQIPTESRHSTGVGLNIFLPADPEKLAQIRARFVMVEEQPQEQEGKPLL